MKRLLITNSTLLLLSLVKDATIFNYFQTHYKTVMDPTIASEEEDERKARTVSEIIECSLELARELLANCEGDMNKVIATCSGSKMSGGGVDQKRPIGSIKSAVIAASDIAQEHIDTEDDKSAAKALKPAAKKVDSSGSDNSLDDEPPAPALAEPNNEPAIETPIKSHDQSHGGGDKHSSDDEKARVCPYCLKTFKNTSNKQDHVKMIHENSTEKKLSCKFCEKLFMSSTAHKYHVDVSHSEKHSKIQCEYCEGTFQHELSMKRHFNSMHKANPKKYQCITCNKSFKRNDYLTVHRRLVHRRVSIAVDMVEELKLPDGNYKCKKCGLVEADKDDIIAHLVEKCKSAKQCVCPVCNKNFSSKFNLSQHIQNTHHDGPINVLSCDVCEFVTRHQSSLVRHKHRKHES